MIVESDVEGLLRRKVEQIGGKAYKFISDGNRGVPDRIICLPGGRAVFVETKRPKGGVLSRIQKYRIAELRRLGFEVKVINTKEQVEDFIREVSNP